MQRTPRSFIKNGKERKNAAFFWKELMPNRVQWFSTFFRFYHMGAFHDLDLLVLRPLKKKKVFRAPPTEGTRGKVFIFKKSQGP